MPMTFDKNTPPNTSSAPKGSEMDLVATHQRCMIAAAMRTQGTILELGVGWYSTPLLHEIAEVQKRRLITLDNNLDWLGQFLPLTSEYHELHLVGWWGDMPVEDEYGLVFVDHSQPIEREYAVRRLLEKSRVQVFVMHDTEEEFAYGYNRTLPMFKYTWTDKCQKAWTTIASNFIDVSDWIETLPPCEHSKEAT